MTEGQWGRKILATALDEANTMSPAVKAQVWLEVAGQLEDDHKTAEERALLKDACMATLEGSPMSYNALWWIQSDILRTMMKNLGPRAVEEMVPGLDGQMRGLAYDLLVTQYTSDRDWASAMQTLRNAPKDQWFPFFPTTQLMNKLPAEHVRDRQEIWAVIYSICQGKRWRSEPIEKFWKELPREQVLETIPWLLRNAMVGDTHPIMRPVYAYQREKPKLFPIWKELDPAAAEQWEQNEAAHWEEAKKQGFSARSDCEQNKPVPETKREPAQLPSPPAPPGAPLPKSVRPASSKPRVVIGCLEDEPWCQQNRIEHLLESLRNHLLKDEDELAKAGVKKGFGYALGQWKLDTDPADPNQVIKTHWPSTVNWEVFAVMASRISPGFALQQVKGIPDPEIQLLTKVVLARQWLDHRPVFPCPQLHSNYHNGGSCIGYYQYLPAKLFDWSLN